MTRPISLFFDDEFENLWNAVTNTSSFPPKDVLIDKDKNLYFRFALAGYDKDNVDISFMGDSMVVKIMAPKEKELPEGFRCISKGIKSSDNSTRFYVPFHRYDTENAKATFENGILNIKVPSKTPEKTRSIPIL